VVFGVSILLPELGGDHSGAEPRVPSNLRRPFILILFSILPDSLIGQNTLRRGSQQIRLHLHTVPSVLRYGTTSIAQPPEETIFAFAAAWGIRYPHSMQRRHYLACFVLLVFNEGIMTPLVSQAFKYSDLWSMPDESDRSPLK
jgi:hypothetical protein